jgi:hypothetical protein
MNSFDEQYSCISKVLIYKQLNLPRTKDFTFRNFTCFDIFVTLPNKEIIWEKWSVYIPTWETTRHYIFYNKKGRLLSRRLVNKKLDF